MQLTSRDLRRLEGVHPQIVRWLARSAESTPIPFTVLEGLRTLDRQRRLVASGASRTLNSYHLRGLAVDLAPLDGGKVSWAWPLFARLATHLKQEARSMGLPIEWGGDWRTFKDGPHWQLKEATK